MDDEEADEGFMSRWRQGRLKELQNGGYESGIHKSGRTRRSYGGLTTVDGEGYLDAVEKSPAQTVVIVYIYDDMVGLTVPPTFFLTNQLLMIELLVTRFANDRGLRPHFGEKAQQHPLRPATLPGC